MPKPANTQNHNSAKAKVSIMAPQTFAWPKPALKEIKAILAKYPKENPESAVQPLLFLAQRTLAAQTGASLPPEVLNLVAETLNMPPVRVYEVATFFTMFQTKPVGKYHLQVCTNCACMVNGSDDLLQTLADFTQAPAPQHGQKTHTEDGTFTLEQVECLGACTAAPMLQLTETQGKNAGRVTYHTHLNREKLQNLLFGLQQGDSPAQKAIKATADAPKGGVL